MRKLALLLLFCAGCAGARAAEAPRTFQRADSVAPLGQNVEAIISVLNIDGLVYENEPLVLELKLANVSTSSVNLNNDLQPGRLVVIEILSEKGDYKRSPDVPLASDSLAGRRYAVVPSGVFIGRQYQIRPSDPLWQLPAGAYSVRVVYRNPHRFAVVSEHLEEGDVRRLGEKVVVQLQTGSSVSNIEQFRVMSGQRKR